MNNFKHIFKLFAFGAISVLILSCSDDDTFIEMGNNGYEQGLIIEPSLPSMEGDFTATRADEPGDPELNENYLGENIDVFITETGQEQIIKTYHYNGEVTDNAEHLLAKNWQNQGLDVNKKYDVYVALNNPQTHQKNGDEYVVFNTLADLRALYTTDDQIFKPYGNDQWDEQADKVFMMDGVAKQWQPVAGQAKQVIPVEMRRAATKIVVSVNFDDKFIRSLDSLSINDPDHSINVGSPRWKHANFAYNTTDFGMDYGEGTTNQLTGDDRNLQTPTGTHWNITSVDREVSYTDIQTTPETANLRKTYNYLTYTYAFSWDETSNAVAEAPYTILTLGFTPKNQAMAVNYYRIPVVKESVVTEIKRNHVYHINANIKGMGASSPTENTFESVDLQYEVLPWVKNESDVYDMITSKSYFLMVSPLNANLYGNNGEIDINYFIAKGESIKITNAQVYFYNSSGTKTYLNATFPTETTYYSTNPSSVAYTGDVTSTSNNRTTVTIDTADGLIHVNSPVLANKAVKYIKFTVSMVSGLTDQTFDVTIIHYPIENIQNFEGLYSTRTLTNWVNWNENNPPSAFFTVTDNNVNGQNWSNRNSVQGGTNYQDIVYYYQTRYRVWNNWTGWYQSDPYYVFNSKVFVKNTNNSSTIPGYCYGFTNTRAENINRNLTNSHMYVIQLTSASDDYSLGVPMLDANSQSNDHVVSPAFMTASQLGAVGALYVGPWSNIEEDYDYRYGRYLIETQWPAIYTFNGEAYSGLTGNHSIAVLAAKHCASYKEVDRDGNVYTGWRLPTREEVGVILKYQADDNMKETIVGVMTGQYYFTLEGKAVKTGYDENETFTGNANDYANPANDLSTADQANGGNGRIRCVRDLTNEDLKRLERQHN